MGRTYQLGTARTELLHGDSVQILREMQQYRKEDANYDLILADPPYASGAGNLSGKQQGTSKKYAKGSALPDFIGDAQDQRSWTHWMQHWLSLAFDLSKDGAVVMLFTDWRQMPSTTDALQWAGWSWRGVVPWDKLNCRPQRGRFRQQAEFIVWGSKGNMPADRGVGVLPGAYQCTAPAAKARRHQTEKPVQLLRQLLRICPAGGKVLDPFMGSGSAEEAAMLEGYDITGIELSDYYYEVACDRCKVMLDNKELGI